ncbi:hypothetical protein [Neorhizobium alkalisoli]|uniref:hypothetical protein n=1 Tax=Neorhizobium alkalisoli TaxID=528178 RepID=UPI00197B237C|nr:hypothetical protein [Neorhizobium alkalisoli]
MPLYLRSVQPCSAATLKIFRQGSKNDLRPGPEYRAMLRRHIDGEAWFCPITQSSSSEELEDEFELELLDEFDDELELELLDELDELFELELFEEFELLFELELFEEFDELLEFELDRDPRSSSRSRRD